MAVYIIQVRQRPGRDWGLHLDPGFDVALDGLPEQRYQSGYLQLHEQ
jgi:hypothetical protein